MSDEIDREETTLGTALSRAVESQPVRETPFEASRLAASLARPARRFAFAPLGVAAAVVLGLALGAYVLNGRRVPAEPLTSASPTAAVTIPSPAPTATPLADREFRVFFARDGLPPLAKPVRVPVEPSIQGVEARLTALYLAEHAETGGPATWMLVRAKVDGDLATVALFGVNVRGAAAELAFLQQLVYTASEEPGVRRVLLTDQDGAPLRVDQRVVDKPLTREDVSGYAFSGTDVTSIAGGGSEVRQDVTSYGVTAIEQPAGLTRFAVTLQAQGDVRSLPGGRLDPGFTATLVRCDPPGCTPGKWAIELELPNAVWTPGRFGGPAQELGVAGPVRALASGALLPGGVAFVIYLDDARPWRVSVAPTTAGSAVIYVDVGGRPQQVTKNVALYTPQLGQEVQRTFTISGAARVFEANVSWRVRDASGKEIASGHTLASIGTSPVWGTFETTVTVPASVRGTVKLEVFWASPKDGSDQDVVSIPLTVR